MADPRDVVTLRVVTRDAGTGPKLFATSVELPRPAVNDARPLYHVLAVDSGGRCTGPVRRPAWLPGPDDEDDGADQLIGTIEPDAVDAQHHALAAHASMPGLFAAAWDVALTPDGPVILEGNTGFGTKVPQWLGGELLAGLSDQPRS